MRSNSPGFWLTVGLVIVVVIAGTVCEFARRMCQLATWCNRSSRESATGTQ